MKRIHSQKGFTLVELAIVMTIIGLLIGGILKGQELMQNARVTSTIAQVKAYEAAVTTFRDSYNAFPGDLTNADTRVPSCNLNCNAVPTAGGGDGVIGDPAWAGASGTPTWAPQLPATGMALPPTTDGEETQLFWIHLLQADLITGITDAAIRTATAPSFGVTHPNAKIGGGFVVGTGNGTEGLGQDASIIGPSGTVLVMTPTPNTQMDETLVGQLAVSPGRAAQIDRKMDDGKPGVGFVQAWGLAGASGAGVDVCLDTAAPSSATDPSYFEANTNKSCGLIFRIQG